MNKSKAEQIIGLLNSIDCPNFLIHKEVQSIRRAVRKLAEMPDFETANKPVEIQINNAPVNPEPETAAPRVDVMAPFEPAPEPAPEPAAEPAAEPPADKPAGKGKPKKKKASAKG